MQPDLQLYALPAIPLVEPGDDIALLLSSALERAGLALQSGDCLVIAQKIVSKSENRYAYLNEIVVSERAQTLALETDKDPRLVELILRESSEVLRQRPGAIIVEHRLGYVHANAGIDQSNIASEPDNPRVLLLPENPDQSAAAIRAALQARTGIAPHLIISDSAGRAWRNGITGFALGTAGFLPLHDDIGNLDLFDKPLRVTTIAVADELAAAASLLMGQASQGVPAVLLRGAKLQSSNEGSASLIRARHEDLFR